MNTLLSPTGDGEERAGDCANHDGGLCARLARIQNTLGDATKEVFE
jgi:hypothetical protein